MRPIPLILQVPLFASAHRCANPLWQKLAPRRHDKPWSGQRPGFLLPRHQGRAGLPARGVVESGVAGHGPAPATDCWPCRARALHRLVLLLAVIVAVTLQTRQALAIGPAFWTHATEADFSAGQADNTIVTNLGDVKLATGTELLGQISDEAAVIHDLQVTATGDTFLAIGPEGALLRRRGDQIERVLSLPGEQVFAMDLLSDGRLLVAVSAIDSRLAVLNGDKLETLVELKGVRYIWDTVVDGEHVFLATGTDGKLLRVAFDERDDDGSPTVVQLLDTAQNNLLCLGRDAQGRIYAGSDGDGLVYRVAITDHDAPQVFVLYDAPEPEIGAILVLGDGTVYAGTADADQARPGRLEEAAAAESGRPDAGQPVKLEGQADEMPRVPPQPDPMDRSEPSDRPGRDTGGGTHPDSDGSSGRAPLPSSGQQGGQHRNASGQQFDTPLRTELFNPAGARSNPTPLQASEKLPQASPDQLDALRVEIRRRLVEARKSGSLQSTKSRIRSTRRLVANKNTGAAGSSSSRSAGEGNAIYRISPDGFVTEIFRESVMILRLLEEPAGNGKLMVATGNEGQLFQVDPAAEETTILVDLDPQQVVAMVTDGQGRVLLGTANPASLMRLESGFAGEGTYTSDVLDASQISLWGKLNVSANTPEGTSVLMQTRSGNVQDPEQAHWSPWSEPETVEMDPTAAVLTPREMIVRCPPARFLQYRLTLRGQKQVTPVVYRIQIAYVVPNLKPVISSIQTKYPHAADAAGTSSTTNSTSAGQQEPTSMLELSWEASDPNQDRLQFTLQYQPAGSVGWLTLAQDLDEQAFEWQTRHVPDGRYLIRVTASDHRDNPPAMAKTSIRRSDPVLVDNTAPVIGPIHHTVAHGLVQMTGQVTDELSSIRSVDYSVDSPDKWHVVLPDDLIYDSTREVFTINIPKLTQGGHVVTLRATDRHGNSRYEAFVLEID